MEFSFTLTQAVPWFFTTIFVGMMLRPYESHGSYDFGPLFRVFWLIPISITWAVYFGVIS